MFKNENSHILFVDIIFHVHLPYVQSLFQLI